MSGDFQELMKQVDSAVKEQFSSDDGRDQFFMHVLDGFGYRYVEDEKCEKAKLEKIGNASYQVSGKTYSMTKALQFTQGDTKAELVEEIKQAMNSERATSLQKIVVDAKDLDSDGAGAVKVYALISWDFPQFQEQSKQILKEQAFQSEDWGQLRKQFPLFLEEVCELF